MSTTDNAITLAQHIIVQTLEPFVKGSARSREEAALILARAVRELGIGLLLRAAWAEMENTRRKMAGLGDEPT